MYYIGIDLGGTQVKMGLVKDETIVERYSFMSKSASGLAPHLKELADVIGPDAYAKKKKFSDTVKKMLG